MAVDRDAQHLALNAPVEALHQTIGLRRVGPRLAVLHLQLRQAASKPSAVKQEPRSVSTWVTLKGNARHRLLQEGDRAGGQLVILDRQVHPARAAVDGHIQKALAALAIGGAQLGQVLHVHVDEAEIVVLEGAAPALALLRRRQAAQPFGLEDAIDASRLRCGRKCVTTKVRSSSGKPVARRRAQTIARSSSVAFQGSLCGRLEWSWQSSAPRLRHLRMVSVLTP